jgi:hypothetical protein
MQPAAYDGDIQMIDSSSVRVHAQAAGEKTRFLSQSLPRGLTTKVHAAVDAQGRDRLQLSF